MNGYRLAVLSLIEIVHTSQRNNDQLHDVIIFPFFEQLTFQINVVYWSNSAYQLSSVEWIYFNLYVRMRWDTDERDNKQNTENWCPQ